MRHYDVIVIGAGPGGIFATYELAKKQPELSIAVFEAGHKLSGRKCPIDGDKIPNCINCKSCSIMSGFGGAGAFSDGKYNITNDFGGTLYEHIGKKQAIELMKYVDEINMEHGGEGTRLFSTAGTKFKKICMQNKLKLLDASVRHLGTDINYVVLENMYNEMKDHIDFYFNTPVSNIEVIDGGYRVFYKDEYMDCDKCIVSVGRSGSKWIENVSIAIVPTMAIFFFGGCLLYLILHADYLLPSLKLIFSSAFAPPSIGGGFAGYTMGKAIRYGVARGLFTNESGLGTTGLIAGHCSEDDSVKQAAISMSATFWDTVVLCAITGLVLVCYQLEFPSEWQTLPASALTTAAFGKLPFFGDEILSIAIISFALATLIGWSYLGKQGFDYLFQGKYERFYQTLYLIMIFSGGIMPLALVWEMTDFINLFLLLPNIYLLVRCRKYVKKE